MSKSSRLRSLGFLLLVAISLLSMTSLPMANAQADPDVAARTDEAEIDVSGEIHIENDEIEEVEGEAEFELEAARVEEESNVKADAALAQRQAEDEAKTAAVADQEEENNESTREPVISNVTVAVKNKVIAFLGKTNITPKKMKKIAAGALVVWGVAAGAGWVMNNLGGEEN